MCKILFGSAKLVRVKLVLWHLGGHVGEKFNSLFTLLFPRMNALLKRLSRPKLLFILAPKVKFKATKTLTCAHRAVSCRLRLESRWKSSSTHRDYSAGSRVQIINTGTCGAAFSGLHPFLLWPPPTWVRMVPFAGPVICFREEACLCAGGCCWDDGLFLKKSHSSPLFPPLQQSPWYKTSPPN